MANFPNFRHFPNVVRATGFMRRSVSRATAAFTVTRPINGGRTTVLDAVAGFTVTLPAATVATTGVGAGAIYRFVVKTALTSGTYVIQVANSTDVMAGGVFINDTGDTSAATVDFFPTAATSDTYTMTQSVGGGKVGDWFEVEDIGGSTWIVRGQQVGVTDPSTPFSAAV